MNGISHTCAILRERLESGDRHDGERLPSLADLAKSCSVSRTTMWRALGVLQNEGLVHAIRGGAIIAGPPNTLRVALNSHGVAWKRLKQSLGQELLQGGFSGRSLPPMAKLALHHGVAVETVAKALLALVDEGLLTRSGRRFTASSRSSLNRRPVVFISQGDRQGGLVLSEHRTQAVVESFERSCVDRGYECISQSYNHRDPNCFLDCTTAVRRMQSPAGFIVNIWNPWDATLWQRWTDLLLFLCKQKVPVVVLDQAGDLTFAESLKRSPLFRVLRISTTRAGEMVADLLYQRGHRRVAFVSSFFRFDWAKKRYAGLCHYLKEYGNNDCRVELFGLHDIESQHDLVAALVDDDIPTLRSLYQDWFSEDQLAGLLASLASPEKKALARTIAEDPARAIIRPFAQTLARVKATQPESAAIADIQGKLLSVAVDQALASYLDPFFRSVLKKSSATAWVCSDEESAIAALYFLRGNKRTVPDDIAIVGFENRVDSYRQQLTTYDFNMNGLVKKALLLIVAPDEIATTPKVSEVEGYIVERKTTGRR